MKITVLVSNHNMAREWAALVHDYGEDEADAIVTISDILDRFGRVTEDTIKKYVQLGEEETGNASETPEQLMNWLVEMGCIELG